jgi:hypothetical protein
MRNRLGVSRWIWEIHQNGTYRFHAAGPDAAPAHSGSFATARGVYRLRSTMGWNDMGIYQLKGNATLITSGNQGTETWHRVQPKATRHGQSQAIAVRK